MAGGKARTDRRQDILQALALMLEADDNRRITTAALASQVGFSEAALYKHFSSKSKIYEALLDFAEEALFSRINAIAAGDGSTVEACGDMLLVMLTFAERNPGVTRLLCGDVLHGEEDHLRKRAGKPFQRLQSDIKQRIKLGELREALTTGIPPGMTATVLVNLVEGRLHQFVRSQFTDKPTADWPTFWPIIAAALFRY